MIKSRSRKKSRSQKRLALQQPTQRPAGLQSPSVLPVTVSILKQVKEQIEKDLASITVQISRIDTICDQLTHEQQLRNHPIHLETPSYVQ